MSPSPQPHPLSASIIVLLLSPDTPLDITFGIQLGLRETRVSRRITTVTVDQLLMDDAGVHFSVKE